MNNGKHCPACQEKDQLIASLVKKCEALTDERDKLKAFDLYKKEAQKELIKQKEI